MTRTRAVSEILCDDYSSAARPPTLASYLSHTRRAAARNVAVSSGDDRGRGVKLAAAVQNRKRNREFVHRLLLDQPAVCFFLTLKGLKGKSGKKKDVRRKSQTRSLNQPDG